MNILGIDFGNKKIGLALADSNIKLAEPLTVVRSKLLHEGTEKIIKVIHDLNIEKVVIGISEGVSAQQAKRFGKSLEPANIEIVYQDETLTTVEAQLKSIEAGIGRNKRKGMEDAYAATLILQDYLDANL